MPKEFRGPLFSPPHQPPHCTPPPLWQKKTQKNFKPLWFRPGMQHTYRSSTHAPFASVGALVDLWDVIRSGTVDGGQIKVRGVRTGAALMWKRLEIEQF